MVNPERFYAAVDEDGTLVGFYYFEEKGDALEIGLGLRPDQTGRGLGADFFRGGSTSGGLSRRWKDHPQRRRLQRARHQGLRARGVPRDRPACAPFALWGDVEFVEMEEAVGRR